MGSLADRSKLVRKAAKEARDIEKDKKKARKHKKRESKKMEKIEEWKAIIRLKAEMEADKEKA